MLLEVTEFVVRTRAELGEKGFPAERVLVAPDVYEEIGRARRIDGMRVEVDEMLADGEYGICMTKPYEEGYDCRRCGLYTLHAAACPRCDTHG